MEIKDLFTRLGIHPNSVVMLHGDAGAFLSIANKRDSVDACVEEILDYFVLNGTIIVPTFTYSATKAEIFSVSDTPSDIGTFSELFRTNARLKRTKHPNFSVSVAGGMSENVLKANVNDAFGRGTVFEFLYDTNAELITIGCSLNALTFTHFVEQRKGVVYRFMKTFLARIEVAGKVENLETTYYVRNLDLGYDTSIDLSKFKDRAIQMGCLRVSRIGRFEATAIRAQDCFKIMNEMLSENALALVRGRI